MIFRRFLLLPFYAEICRVYPTILRVDRTKTCRSLKKWFRNGPFRKPENQQTFHPNILGFTKLDERYHCWSQKKSTNGYLKR